MKKVFTIIFAMLIGGFISELQAQIPNPGFEDWSGGNPVNWLVYNIPPDVITITQTTDYHSGSYAAKGEVIEFSGNYFFPLITSETTGFAISTRYGEFTGWYKLELEGGDSFFATCVVFKNDNIIGGGDLTITGAVSDFTKFSVPLTYIETGDPDMAFITISIDYEIDPHLGTWFIVDDLALEGSAGVDDKKIPFTSTLCQNYPNPFNESTKISFTLLNSDFVTLKVIDALVRK